MKRLALLLVMFLGACGRPVAAPGGKGHGRYQGIGLFAPSRTWAQLKGMTAPGDADGATLADDEAVIVVVDSATGEVRECGNLSAMCLSLNPWTRAVVIAPAMPAALVKHAAELAKEDREAVPPGKNDNMVPAPDR